MLLHHSYSSSSSFLDLSKLRSCSCQSGGRPTSTIPSSSSVSAPDAPDVPEKLSCLVLKLRFDMFDDARLSWLTSLCGDRVGAGGAGGTRSSTIVLGSSVGDVGRGVRSRSDDVEADIGACSDISRSAVSIRPRTRFASSPTSSVVRSTVGIGGRTVDSGQ
jgi:hypothetical protein